jgi:hypothetical protein
MPATANVLPAATFVNILTAVSAANTAAATSAGVDLTPYEGMVKLLFNVGAITGSMANLKVQGSTDNSTWNDLTTGGTAAASVTANTQYSLDLDVRKVITSAGYCRYIRVIGTITTGPTVIGVTMCAFKKVGP